MNNLPEELAKIVKEVDEQIAGRLHEIDEQVIYNQAKVLEAFVDNAVAESDLKGTNGYGDDDEGRDKLERVYAQVFHTEDALVRPQFVSGTHTLATALDGNLVPGDTLTYLTGMPYDTLQHAIGLTPDKAGTLIEKGVKFSYVPLKEDGSVDFEEGEKILKRDQPKIVAIQRSRGYDTRESFPVAKVKEMIDFIKEVSPQSLIFVDNCYGEFSEKHEPTEYGADFMAGSLIKNAGGGIAQTGGYIVGRKDLIHRAASRLFAPGISDSEGPTLNSLHEFYEGFFLAPNVTGEAIKGMIYSASLMEKLGFDVSPKWDAPRTDLIELITFNDKEKMIKFCQEVQKNSPVDSFVTPIPSHMRGYEDEVIMAGGTFVSGSTVEFSADGPIRPPYAVYMQGGLTYAHDKIAVTNAVKSVLFGD